MFEQSIELASELGLVDGPAEQIVDSTPMLGAAAVQDTAVLVRSAVGKLIDAVAAADIRAAGELRDALRNALAGSARVARTVGVAASDRRSARRELHGRAIHLCIGSSRVRPGNVSTWRFSP